MKTTTKLFKSLLAILVAGTLVLSGCSKKEDAPLKMNDDYNGIQAHSAVSAGHFTINLLSEGDANSDGNYVWTWEVNQTRSGKGFPGLSHFNFYGFECLNVMEEVVSVCWSSDNENWECEGSINFKPDGKGNASNDCYSGNILKSDFGQGSKNYYRIVVNKEYCVGTNQGVIKAGNGCISAEFPGIGCECPPPPANENCWTGETAMSEGERYTSSGNWFTFTELNGQANTVTLYAGQTHDVGLVSFSAPVNGKVTITISFNSNGRLQAVKEAIKVKGYATSPVGNSPGGIGSEFTDYQGNELSFEVDAANYYGVHVDVERRVTCN